MIVVYPKSGQPIEISSGAAVRHATLPATPEQQARSEQPAASLEVLTTDGRVLAVFRASQLAGWNLTNAGADA